MTAGIVVRVGRREGSQLSHSVEDGPIDIRSQELDPFEQCISGTSKLKPNLA